jgi:ribonuclease BN (tRNA processing enzyme)
MKIIVLGSGSGMPSADRQCSCFWVQSGSKCFLIDAGEGAARQLVRMKCDPNDVDAIFITHMHPDHASGLFTILQFMNLNGRTNALSIFVPRGVFPGFSTVLPYFQIFENQWPFSMVFQPLDGGTQVSIGDFSLLPVANAHLAGHSDEARKHSLGCDSYSFVFNDRLSGSILYTSDIPDFIHLENLRDRTDLLISECTHVPLPMVLDFCRRHGILKLVLTHLSTDPSSLPHPSSDDGTAIQCQWAKDGTVLEV